MHDDLTARAQSWLAEDPDPDTREELAKLLEAGDHTELAARFSGTLQFGTAGLRGELGAGPMRMNRAVVIRAAAGLAAYLKAKGEQNGLVVIGYDARHKSAEFAQDTASVIRRARACTPGVRRDRRSRHRGRRLPGSRLGAVVGVGDHLHGRRTGILLAVLRAAFPVGLVQWMGYTESLFTACAAWSLYAVLTGRWLCAATLAVLAGLTRPSGVAVAAAVTVAALLARRSPRALAAAVLAPLGWCGYFGWVGLRLGRWDGYFAVQRLWHNEWNGGSQTLRRMRDLLVSDARPHLFLVMVTMTLLACSVLYGLSVADRQPLPLLVFSGVLLLIVLGSGGVYFPRARFLLPAFPLLLPVALHLARASRRHRALVLAAAVAVSAYVSCYMVMVWPSAP
ncbi:hypothetical protein SAURM35S_00986 [Streptomyces aurantiogriseus]